MQSKTIIDVLSNETISKFIQEHLKGDAKKLALATKKYPNYNLQVISSLISVLQKAEIKLPEHYKNLAAFNQKSYEQCTSEAVAIYKASIMGVKNKTIINLTGGIGIDDWAMSDHALKIDSCEIDHDIHSMAKYNLSLFNINNVTRHFGDGIAFIKTHETADILYVDPDRRPNTGRVFRIEDSEPDVISNMPLFLEKAEYVWLKLSPMADITYVLKSFPTTIALYVIAWLGEVKELLICCSNKSNAAVKKVAVNIGTKSLFAFEDHSNNPCVSFSNIGQYLYEPNKAIIKAELSADYATSCNLHLLSTNSHFFISDHLVPNFYGRTFKIIERLLYKPKTLKTYLAKNKIFQANITTRNFRESSEELKVRFRLKDGGATYLCFTIDQEGHNWLYHCHQILTKD